MSLEPPANFNIERDILAGGQPVRITEVILSSPLSQSRLILSLGQTEALT